MYYQKTKCVLLQIKYMTDKQILILKLIKKPFLKFIYDVLKQRRNSKSQTWKTNMKNKGSYSWFYPERKNKLTTTFGLLRETD